jgi:hypothetical protein
MHQLTAYAGQNGDVQYRSSKPSHNPPGFDPSVSNYEDERAFVTFLKHANATSLVRLRAALPRQLWSPRTKPRYTTTSYGTTGLGPARRSSTAPSSHACLASCSRKGLYAKNAKNAFSRGHKMDEGLIGADPVVQNASAFWRVSCGNRRRTPRQRSSTSLKKTELYQPIFDIKVLLRLQRHHQPSRHPLSPTDPIVCNASFLLKAFGVNNSHASFFGIGPSLHGEESPYNVLR